MEMTCILKMEDLVPTYNMKKLIKEEIVVEKKKKRKEKKRKLEKVNNNLKMYLYQKELH